MLHPDQKPLRLASVKGMNDILPEQAALWAHFEDAAQTTLRAYGYQRIRTPIVEHTSLFARSIGAATDIVEKEMYCFYDGPKRLWYSGPMFRHERPQRGRYRQFHQLGVEALGFAGPDVDAEIILAGQ